MQSLLNLALRSLVRLGHWKSLPSFALWRELGFRPICALAAGRRIRAFLKCQELSTWVSDLVATPYLTRRWTWVTGVGRWTTRHCPPHSPLSQRQWDGWQGWTQHEAKGNVEEAITTREESIRLHGYRKRPETNWYMTGDYTESPLCRPQWAYSPRLNPGIALIIRLRMGALATTALLIEWEKLPAALLASWAFSRTEASGRPSWRNGVKAAWAWLLGTRVPRPPAAAGTGAAAGGAGARRDGGAGSGAGAGAG
jgi:hypothetical protein